MFGEANIHFKATKELLDKIGPDKLSIDSQINFHLQMGVNARALGDPFGSIKSLKKALLLLGPDAFDTVCSVQASLIFKHKDLYSCTHYWLGISEGNQKEAAQYLLNFLTTLLGCEKFSLEQCSHVSRALYQVSLYARSVGNFKFSKELLFDASVLAKLSLDNELSAQIDKALSELSASGQDGICFQMFWLT